MIPYHFYGGFTHYWYRHWLPATGFAIDSITPVGGPGQACVAFCYGFYAEWSAAEKKLGGAQKFISRVFRLPAKILFHSIFPRLLPRFDPWLGSNVICLTYLVAAKAGPVTK
jgi:hypothetical protein